MTMAVKITYRGRSDVRLLSKDDLKKHGVSVDEDLVFKRGEEVSVAKEVRDLLVDNPVIFGQFTKPDEEPEAVAVNEPPVTPTVQPARNRA